MKAVELVTVQGFQTVRVVAVQMYPHATSTPMKHFCVPASWLTHSAESLMGISELSQKGVHSLYTVFEKTQTIFKRAL